MADNAQGDFQNANVPVHSSPSSSSSTPSIPSHLFNDDLPTNIQPSGDLSSPHNSSKNSPLFTPFKAMDVSGLLSHNYNPKFPSANSSNPSNPFENSTIERFSPSRALLADPVMHIIGMNASIGTLSGLENIVPPTSPPGRSHSTTATPAHSEDENDPGNENNKEDGRNLISFASSSESSDITSSTVRANTAVATVESGHTTPPDNQEATNGHSNIDERTTTNDDDVFSKTNNPANLPLIRPPLFSYPFTNIANANFSPAVFNHRNPNNSLPSFSDSFGTASPAFQSTPRSVSHSNPQIGPIPTDLRDGTFTVFASPSSADPNGTIPCQSCILQTCEFHRNLPEVPASVQSPAPSHVQAEVPSCSTAANASVQQSTVAIDARPPSPIPTSSNNTEDGRPVRQRQPPSRLQYSPSYITVRGRGRGRGAASTRSGSRGSSRGRTKKGQ